MKEWSGQHENHQRGAGTCWHSFLASLHLFLLSLLPLSLPLPPYALLSSLCPPFFPYFCPSPNLFSLLIFLPPFFLLSVSLSLTLLSSSSYHPVRYLFSFRSLSPFLSINLSCLFLVFLPPLSLSFLPLYPVPPLLLRFLCSDSFICPPLPPPPALPFLARPLTFPSSPASLRPIFCPYAFSFPRQVTHEVERDRILAAEFPPLAS